MSYPAQPLAPSVLTLWIDGTHTPSAGNRTADVFNPATGEAIRKVAPTNRADVDRAVAAARAAFPGWRETTPLKRARILTRFRELMEAHRQELVGLISEEHGKTLLDARSEERRGGG